MMFRKRPPEPPDTWRESRELLARLQNEVLGTDYYTADDREIANLTPVGLVMLINHWGRRRLGVV